MPNGRRVSSARAASIMFGETSTPTTVAPRWANSRVLSPSPQPASSTRCPDSLPTNSKNAGLL